MLFVNAGLLALAQVGIASAATPGYQAKPENIVPGAYIVTFEDALPSASSFYQNLTANGIAVSTRRTFDPSVFAGVSFNLNTVNDTHLDTIGNFTQVKSITPVRLHKRAAPAPVFTKSSKKFAASTLRQKRAVGSNVTMTTHQMTGVDKLHAEGLDGTGIKIGIIDTGVDYTLAALGGGYGPGYKIALGYDLVGDYDPDGNPAPDNDPMDCLGHGTHVAGIIGASNDPYILGVAPNASLYVYKVFACEDSAPTDVLIAAFIMAHNDGVDVITSSIGSDNGWPEDPWAAATAAIVKAGTPCMLAAGNAGEDGLFYASTAASGTDVTAIGSVDNINTPFVGSQAFSSVGSSSQIQFSYTPGIGDFSGVTLPVAASSLTLVADDGCAAIATDFTDKIALIRRGTCTFDTKVANAVAAGAKYVVLYNNVAGTISPSITNTDIIAVAMVEAVTGEAFVAALVAGEEVILTFTAIGVFTPGPVNNVTGGSMSYYSSYGLDAENNIKPVVSAPGGNILSTYLSSENSYAVLSGTSMATPFVAGVVALYMQAKGKSTLKPADINNALSASATSLKFNDRTTTFTYLSSVAQQGSGMVNAYAMVHTGIVLSETNIALNDTGHFEDKPDFYITNTGKTAVTYTLTHEPAVNLFAFDASYGISSYAPSTIPSIDQQYSSISFNPSSVTIAPGSQKHIRFTVTPNPSLNETLVPVYSGFIKITASSSSDTAHIPYAGVAARMNDIPIADTSIGLYEYEPNASISTYSFKNSTIDLYKPSEGSYPSYVFSNTWATKNIRVDIVALSPGTKNLVYAIGLKTVGSLPGFPQTYVPRTLEGYAFYLDFDGYLADGTQVPSGAYQVVLRLAKAFANPSRAQDYETFESVPFYLDMS